MIKKTGLLCFAMILTMTTWAVNANEAPVVDLSSTDSSAQIAPETANENAQSAPDTQAGQAVGADQPSQANTPLIAPETTQQVDMPSTENLPITERTTRLEKKMDNLTQMNLPQEIASLQQKMQELSGQMQVLQHDLKLLNDQQRSFYQDLNQRIKQPQNPNNSSDNSSSVTNSKMQAQEISTHVKVKESTVYKKAFDLLAARKYDAAREAFSKYLNDYPKGDFADNAYYWLGEIYVTQKNYVKAGEQFSAVIDQFPKSAKAADAKLKLAIVHIQLGKKDLAKRELIQIKNKYPGSTASQLASIELQKLQLDN